MFTVVITGTCVYLLKCEWDLHENSVKFNGPAPQSNIYGTQLTTPYLNNGDN